jgi:LacI family transcriptional regulator
MNVDKEIEYLKILAAKKVDALIMWPVGTEAQLEKHIQPFIKNRKPVVCIYRKLTLPETKSITIDAYAGAYEATQYLIEKGHRRISSRKIRQPIREITPMLSGCQQALEDRGIEFAPELQKPMSNYNETYQSVTELLATECPPTAIYTTGDYQALGAINAITDSGLRIPDDVAVVGNNDIECAAMSNPPLTTVSVPKHEVGELAGRMVLDFLDGKDIQNCELKPKLIIRKST